LPPAHDPETLLPERGGILARHHPVLITCLLASIAGFLFASVSTADFVAHLDRQVHGIHCSFLPGLSDADQSGESGCHATLMSPYSSVLRSSIWGGLPIALPAMSVFSFLGFWCVWMLVNQRALDERASAFLFTGSLVPLAASGAMGYLSIVELNAACKLCIGIYASSAILSAASLAVFLKAKRVARDAPSGLRSLSWTGVALAFSVGVITVATSVGAYAATAPDFSTYVGACGELDSRPNASSALLPYGPQKGRTRLLEVLDPLCPSCRGFEERLSKMEALDRVDRELLLFPLDNSCNWMVDRALHPGACSISEAVLCAADPGPVIDWAFANQKRIMAATERDPKAAMSMAKARFPAIASCIGSPEAKAQLNRSLRWAVDHQLDVLTPQVFVEGIRLCGEDTDLGLDFALPRLITLAETRPKSPRTEEPAEADEEGAVFAARPEPNPRTPAKKESSKAKDEKPEPATETPPEPSAKEAAPSDAAANQETDVQPKAQEKQDEPSDTAASPPEKSEAAPPPESTEKPEPAPAPAPPAAAPVSPEGTTP